MSARDNEQSERERRRIRRARDGRIWWNPEKQQFVAGDVGTDREWTAYLSVAILEGAPYVYELRLVPGGYPFLDTSELPAKGISGGLLREVRISEILKQGRVADRYPERDGDPWPAQPKKRPPRRGRPPRTDDEHREMAKLYRRARSEQPHRPVARLRELMANGGHPPPIENVRRWLRQARSAGFLPEA